MDDPSLAQLYLGCIHEKKQVKVHNREVSVMTCNMQAYLESAEVAASMLMRILYMLCAWLPSTYGPPCDSFASLGSRLPASIT